MKKILVSILLFAFAALASAQTVSATANLSWTNPTAPTPASAITAIEVYASTSPIADTNTTLAPFAVLTGSPSNSTQSITAPNGATMYFRLKAVNAAGKSAFSNQASKLIDVAQPPGVPTNLTVTIVISP